MILQDNTSITKGGSSSFLLNSNHPSRMAVPFPDHGSTVSKILNDDLGAILISVILGLGLAAMLRASCHGDSCIIIKSPPQDQIEKYVYRIDSQCYKYSPYAVGCSAVQQ